MKTELQNYTHSTFRELNRVFSIFTEDQIDLIPFEDSWTAGQVGERCRCLLRLKK